MLPLPPQMKSPRDTRSTWLDGVLQIHVTRACDKACFNCTQGSNLGGKPTMITPEQFEVACQSLAGYYGVVGMFGGNPAMHPKFDVLCEIMRKYIPANQRGLWCNHPRGKGAIMRQTFNPGVSNLNVHMDQEAWNEFKRDWPESCPFGLDKDSRHSPPWTAMKDLDYLVIAGQQVENNEENRWKLIATCDVNQNWSAMVCVVRGEVKGFFCEIAGAQAMLHEHDPEYPDTGVPAVPGWWNQPMSAFEAQARFHCHNCGIPLRGYGSLALTGPAEQVTAAHADIYKPKTKDRLVELVTSYGQLGKPLAKMTDYMGNANR